VSSTTESEARRRRLADTIQASGDLRSPAWRAAVEAVPREDFLPAGIFQRDDSGEYTAWNPVRPDTAGYLDLVYEDQSWVTQIDGETTPAHAAGPVEGAPTSSSTLPSLVVRMLEDLGVEDGMSVLEIGTGTGYSTALLCQRLGSELVTSIEVDPEVAGRAAAHLKSAGYDPSLIVGDGLEGVAGQHFDRIIATCSVRAIPSAWLKQASVPGGRILTTLWGWTGASALVCLDLDETGHGHGAVLPGMVSFMPARAHQAPPLPVLPERLGTSRATAVTGEVLGNWTARWVAQLAAPTAQMVQYSEAGGQRILMLDRESGSAAWFTEDGDHWTMTQAGTKQIGDQIEDALARWTAAGEPDQSTFRIDVEPDRQTIHHPTLGSWDLPRA
jgi:methyltransferase of ATP-grasp peptide maturase system